MSSAAISPGDSPKFRSGSSNSSSVSTSRPQHRIVMTSTGNERISQTVSSGIEMIDIPESKMSGKNSADIRMVVDALDLCYSKQHIDFFALISGDSDFSPLVSKLKENNNHMLGFSVI